MEENIVNCEIESYALFVNIDKSVLELNQFLEKLGYKFVCYNLEELERDFVDLFSLSNNYNSKKELDFEGLLISMEFFKAISANNYFSSNILTEKEFVFLKKVNNFQLKIVNNQIEAHITNDLQNITSNLIQQLRLYKQGDVSSCFEFQIDKDSRKIMQIRTLNNYPLKNNKMFLTKGDVLKFSEIFNTDFKVNNLSELALNNFNLSYNIDDTKTKYITLMTCLESLFNQGRVQITHTVSRHLALIISKNLDEFNLEYTRTKQLYGLRSAIVHGSSTKENIMSATKELQEKVRKSLNYCLKLNCTKEELFGMLNSAGYSKLDI